MNALLAKALARRLSVRSDQTDCFRVFDGAGDGIPDLLIDTFADRWLVQTRGGELPAWVREFPIRSPDEPAGGMGCGTPLPVQAVVTPPDDPTGRRVRQPMPPQGVSFPRSIYWKRLDQTNKEPPVHVAGEPVAEPFLAKENGVKYWIDFAAGYSQGIFLDQRPNRLRVLRHARGREILNLFSYTCGFSVCAGVGGGKSVSVDLSRPSLDWGKRNFEANGLDPADHEFIVGEASDWLRRFNRKGRTFDLIVLDPPTFSRDKKGKVFRVERDFGTLSGLALSLLRPRGSLLCTTNQRTLSRGAFSALILQQVDDPGAWKLEYADMPPDFTGEKYLKACWVSRRG